MGAALPRPKGRQREEEIELEKERVSWNEKREGWKRDCGLN